MPVLNRSACSVATEYSLCLFVYQRSVLAAPCLSWCSVDPWGSFLPHLLPHCPWVCGCHGVCQVSWGSGPEVKLSGDQRLTAVVLTEQWTALLAFTSALLVGKSTQLVTTTEWFLEGCPCSVTLCPKFCSTSEPVSWELSLLCSLWESGGFPERSHLAPSCPFQTKRT